MSSRSGESTVWRRTRGRARRAGLWRACAACAALAWLGGCGEAKAPVAPAAELPPPVVEVHPEARSTGVPYDTEAWARFSVSLDPATVNERTVFLKLDTVRIPSTITYDEATRTIRIVPGRPLDLLRTHTVEITPAVAMAGGGSLGQTYFWQFRTVGLRRLEHPLPESGVSGESPYVMLQWDATEPSAGTVAYDVYAGADSAAVAMRAVARVTASQAHLVPRASWGSDARRYWAVDAFNRTTGESFTGPVWSFATLPAATPVDSLVVPAADWAVHFVPQSRTTCMGATISCGPDYHDGIHFQFARRDLRLARARLVTFATSNAGVDLNTFQPHIAALATPWAACDVNAAKPALESGPLAIGFQSGLAQPIRFEGEAFTAYLEAAVRFGVGNGYSFRSSRNLAYASPATLITGYEPVLKLYYYRITPQPAP